VHDELTALFPSYVALASLIDPDSAEPLHREEEPAVAKAVEKRRVEFAMGRTCARRALCALGLSPVALPANRDRSVQWPREVQGSITHTEGLCVAVAARSSDLSGIGIDAERADRVTPKIWKQIASPAEIGWFEAAQTPGEAAARSTLLFSAKEAFYKAQFCVTQAWVGFHDVELSATDDGHFEVRVVKPIADRYAAGTLFQGRFATLAEHVVTGLVIP